MLKSISMLIAVIAMFWCVVSSGQQHLVCKNIEDVFTDDGLAETQPRHRGIQGPPGKMGLKGERGIRGLPGAEGGPGRVDYDRVDNVIDEKITNSWSVMNSTIAELKKNLSTLLSELEELKPIVAEMKRKEAAAAAAAEDECRREGGLFHSGKCITVHVSSSRDMNYDEAVAKCVKHESLLAEIRDRVQYSTLYEFALTKMPAGRSYVYVWLGMEYKLSTSTLLYRSGMEKQSNQFQWDTEYPSSSSSLYKYMVMEVGNDGDADIGIWNQHKSGSTHGVMCEKET